MVSAAERIQISSGGFAVWHWLVVVEVAQVGGYGAGGVAAAAGPNLDGSGEPPGWVAAEFGDVEKSAVVVGEQPGEQHLVAACCGRRRQRFGPCSISPAMKPDRSASSAGVSLASSRLASGTTTPMRLVCGRLINRGLRLGIGLVWRSARRVPRWLAVRIEALQTGAEQFAGVGVDVLDLQPAAVER